MNVSKILPQDALVRRAWMTACCLSLLLLLLPAVVPLNGRPHAEWQQFLGRFHPMVVHLPITMLLIVPLLEIMGAYRPSLRESASIILCLAWLSCIASLMLGYLLAYGSGNAGAGVTRHMWGAIVLTICTAGCLLVRPSWTAGMTSVYPFLLTATCLVMMWSAHQGGGLTHGNNYLTEHLPGPLKALSLGGSKANPQSFYAKHIDPILDKRCVSCHGEGQVKGELRMDTFDALMKGGKDGEVIVPNKPEESLLLKRVTLPQGHKLFMPAEGKPPLSDEEISLIRAWILQGASPTAETLQGVGLREAEPEMPIQPVADYSELQAEIDRMKRLPGAKLLTVSAKPSDGLILTATDVANSFGDAQLAEFEKFAPYVVEADLSRTAITDASFATLARFTHLRKIRLDGTGVTGKGIAALSNLKQLTYLNLSNTRITSDAAKQLSSLRTLRHLYLFNTPAQPLTPTASDTRKAS